MPGWTRPVTVAHADWGASPAKRWIAIATLSGTSRRLGAPEPVAEVTSLLEGLKSRASGGTLVVGFDFPIGLPWTFAKRAQVSRFLDILPHLGRGDWARFYDIAVRPADISCRRPFYPYRPGGTAHHHLTSALGVSSIRDLLRLCDRRTANRNDACAIFWTLGANQVGRGAIIGWRDVLAPALANPNLDVALWPFDGSLADLLRSRQCIIAETYPAEACVHLGMTPGRGWSKQEQKGRKAQSRYLFEWAESRGIILDERLEENISSGFPYGDDPFDALVGLMSMVDVVSGCRPEGAPASSVVREVEGWILGQSPEPAD